MKPADLRLNLVFVMSCVVITGCSTTRQWLDQLGRGSGTNAVGLTEAEIVSNYPGITREDILGCLAYARDVLSSEKGFPSGA